MAAVVMSVSLASAAFGQIFVNAGPISIPDFGSASPYPSTITVSGVTNPVSGFRIRLKNFSHTYPGDVKALLVAPNGQAFQFFTSVGTTPVTNVNLTFAGESTAGLPTPMVSGTYGLSGGSDSFPGVASTFPRASNVTSLFTPNVNGQWRLFVNDFSSQDAGSIAGGWEIEFGDFGFLHTAVNTTVFTYQGRLEGVAANATVDLRFSMWDSEIGTNLINLVRSAVTVPGVTLNNGNFTASVDFGALPPSDRAVWLQIEVASPSGGAFTTLPVRQKMTNTPFASVALRLSDSTLVPDVAVIGGRQLDNTSFAGSSLTIRAAGQPNLSGFGTPGGELRLVGGNNNNASNSPTPGVSNGGDIALFPGFNHWNTGWNGNIRFHGGPLQREYMRIVGDNGNVGIGTTTPTAKLDVRGEIVMGANGDQRPMAARTAQRLTAGVVNNTGAIVSGTGFTSIRNGPGNYIIFWTQADGFSAIPAVLVTPLNGTSNILYSVQSINWNPNGSGSTTIQFVRSSDQNPIDVFFSVMIVGSR